MKETCIKLRNREMENEETKTVPKSWAMVGGDGPRSYAQNSSYQVYILSLNIFYRLI
jgi:indole-3-acetate O-methyltransferase